MSETERKNRWARLLSTNRLFCEGDNSRKGNRSEFECDHDRVIFSSAFRRLKDKTQVFPLSPSDYTRTRLTHSLEASCVGRSLGREAETTLIEAGLVESPRSDIATLVATACLAHDIGNPPFGHSGEDAISKWAESRKDVLKLTIEEEQRDLEQFEGNAQGFRIMTRLQNRRRKGGIQPTLALLGTMTKYPRASSSNRQDGSKRASEKKHGFFQDDKEAARSAFEKLGLMERASNAFARHPLAFLTEAADDICYIVMDLEDAFKLKIVPFDETKKWLCSLTNSFEHRPGYRESTEIARLRAIAVYDMTMACAEVFRENLVRIEDGSFDQSLISATGFAKAHEELIGFEREHVYSDERVLQIEYAGYKTIGGLLDIFCDAALAEKPSQQQEKLLKLLPDESFDRPDIPKGDRLALTRYQRVLAMTDFVSGMTDSYAVELYQRLSGIQLPA